MPAHRRSPSDVSKAKATSGDIGPVVNLSGAENQVEGSVVDGYSTALGLQLSIENGRIQETNFDRYPLLRIPLVQTVARNWHASHP